jgi:hypothetical protein
MLRLNLYVKLTQTTLCITAPEPHPFQSCSYFLCFDIIILIDQMTTLTVRSSKASTHHSSGPPSPGSDSSEKTAVEPLSPKSSFPKCDACRLREAESHQSASEKRLDPAKDLTQVLHGWPELANLMANHPEFVSFPAFRRLSIKSLLYYQCQISKLEKDLHKLEWQDHRGAGFASKYCENIDTLLLHKGDDDKAAHQQIDKIEEIRKVLEKYRTYGAHCPLMIADF